MKSIIIGVKTIKKKKRLILPSPIDDDSENAEWLQKLNRLPIKEIRKRTKNSG